MITYVYRIQSNDGLFSRGGTHPIFDDKGKVWKRKCDLSCHINRLDPHKLKEYRDKQVRVIRYMVTEEAFEDQSLEEYISKIEGRTTKCK
jgi:hypothetical protein